MTSVPQRPPQLPPRAPWRRAARPAAIGLGGLVLGVGALYGVAYAITGSDVPRGTSVLGVDVGGLSLAAAEARLAERLPAALPRSVTVTADGESMTRDAADLGLAADPRATAERARAGAASPLRLIPSLFGRSHDVEPALAVDEPRLAGAVAELAQGVHRDFVEGAIDFAGGRASAVQPVPGRSLDEPATAAALRRAFAGGEPAVVAPVSVLTPTVGPDAVARALAEFGDRAVAGPVAIVLAGEDDAPPADPDADPAPDPDADPDRDPAPDGDPGGGTQIVELLPARLGEYLSTTPAAGALTLAVDAEGLAAGLAAEEIGIGQPARDASIEIVDGVPTVTPARVGMELDARELATELRAVLTAAGGGERVVSPAVRATQPEFTTAEAEALGITEKLSSFRTEYPIAPYRVTNIGRAAELIDGSIVEPGETWSLNSTLGKRTKANGFVEGLIIRDGNFVEDLGGGVSQSATTVFNAVFFAGLKDVEHHPHSLYISRYPAGREATVAFGSKDLRFANDSGHGVLIQAEAEPGYIEVTMWGTKVWDEIASVSSERRNIIAPMARESDAKDCETQQPVDGFHIDVTRIFIRDGAEVRRETFTTKYEPTDKIDCVTDGTKPAGPTPLPTQGATPAPAGSPAPSASPSPAARPGASPGPSPGATPEPTRKPRSPGR